MPLRPKITLGAENSPIPDVKVSFYDNFVPSLRDGEYTITAEQQLAVNTTQTQSDGGNANINPTPQPAVSQKFIVRGPRFVLDPAEIHRTFPPKNSTGAYNDYLPMMVFNKRSLPWERDLKMSDAQKTALAPFNNPDIYPWMALLVFTEDQLITPQPASGPPKPILPGSLANPTLTASLPLTQVLTGATPGLPTGIAGPTLTLADDEDPTQIFCNVIDISAQTFTNLVPTLADLRFLAHVREVSTVYKETNMAANDGWYSSIIANRFGVQPAAGDAGKSKKNIVHLVSLEGLERFIGANAQAAISGYEKIRLISLCSWTFDCLANPQENFSQLMMNLVDKESEQGTQLLMKMPPPASTVAVPAEVSTRLQNGYVPLGYATRTGEQTFAWYRGPMAPVLAPPLIDAMDVTSPTVNNKTPLNASEAMIYNTTTGLFDQSYAVAFQTGRSMALANSRFSTDLIQWRTSAHGLVDRLVERMRSTNMRGALKMGSPKIAQGLLGTPGVTDLLSVLETNALTASFKKYLAGDFKVFASGMGKNLLGSVEQESELVVDELEEPTLEVEEINVFMQQTNVVSLLGHLSGLSAIGSTSGVLSGSLSSIVLASPGATVAVPAGSTITIAPTTGTSVQVAVLADVGVGDTEIQILPYDFQTPLASGSAVRISDTNILPPQIISWLSEIALLYGVPFNNILPDARLLPKESIRFFYLDQNWINAMIDGALSVGVQSSRDQLFTSLMRNQLLHTVNRSSVVVRDLLRNAAPVLTATAPGTKTGFVLRSPVVEGWPGLEIKAWSAGDSVNPMKLLRMDRVSPDLLVVMFPDIPVKININEPSEGLVFGMEDQGIAMRYLPGMQGATATNTGAMIGYPPGKWVTKSDIGKRTQPANEPALIINGTGGLVQAIQNKLNTTNLALSPASLAVEMVRVPEQMTFTPLKTS